MFDEMTKELDAGLYEASQKECLKLREERDKYQKENEKLKIEIEKCYSEIKDKETIIAETYNTHFRFSESERNCLLDLIEISVRLRNDAEMYNKLADRLA